jgi:hypothetical protein
MLKLDYYYYYYKILKHIKFKSILLNIKMIKSFIFKKIFKNIEFTIFYLILK